VTDSLIDRRTKLLTAIEAATPTFRELALQLHATPEIGLAEEQAARWLSHALEAEGFTITTGVAELPTAFVASWGQTPARPVIAFLAEYDALPKLGHACGHNLIAGCAALAAVSLANSITPEEARIRLVGCPAEESYGGKIQLVDRGIFADVDIALMAHGYYHHLATRPASGRQSVVFEFFGKSAHAAAAPQHGANALDAMILTFNAAGLLRQQLPSESRLHGIITHGGNAANTIPDYTRAEFYVRSFDPDYLQQLADRLIACARGAAEATGTRLEVSSATLTMLPIRQNATLAQRYQDNVLFLGEQVDTAAGNNGAGSTDFGNVSQVVPALHAYFKVSDSIVGAHTVEFAEASAGETGLAGMVLGAKALALTAFDLIADPRLLAAAQQDFQRPAPSEGGSA
jgi:amidohydrolase